MLRVSVVAPTGRSLRVEIIRLRKKRKEQSYVKNLLVLKHLLKQGPLWLFQEAQTLQGICQRSYVGPKCLVALI